MTKEEVKALITEKIKTNGKGEITAKVLAEVLNSVVEACSANVLELDFRNMNLGQQYTITELIGSGFITEDKVRAIFDGQYDAIKLQFENDTAIYNRSFCGYSLADLDLEVHFGGYCGIDNCIESIRLKMPNKTDFNSITFIVNSN